MINLKIDFEKPFESFKWIANDLMNYWHLVAGEKKHRITEIEFYLKHYKLHNDPYVHGHEKQKTSHHWYFHGSGIDFTFGQEDYYGGILIRAIYNIDDKTYHYGPLVILTEIFSGFPDVYNIHPTFGIAPVEYGKFEIEKPIAAPRVGLNPKKDKAMHDKYYRFLIMPRKKHAEKTRIEEAMKEQGCYTQEQIRDIWG